jgi:hypothetical protein
MRVLAFISASIFRFNEDGCVVRMFVEEVPDALTLKESPTSRSALAPNAHRPNLSLLDQLVYVRTRETKISADPFVIQKLWPREGSSGWPVSKRG